MYMQVCIVYVYTNKYTHKTYTTRSNNAIQVQTSMYINATMYVCILASMYRYTNGCICDCISIDIYNNNNNNNSTIQVHTSMYIYTYKYRYMIPVLYKHRHKYQPISVFGNAGL